MSWPEITQATAYVPDQEVANLEDAYYFINGNDLYPVVYAVFLILKLVKDL